MLNLREFLLASDFDFIHAAVDYALSNYDCGEPRAVVSLEGIRGLTERAADPFEVSFFDLYCTMRIVQLYLKDMDDLGSKEEIIGTGNGVLGRLAIAGTRGAKFTVGNTGEPLED